jgi:hypothetical protein
MYACIHACFHVFMLVCTHVHVYMYVYMHACLYTHKYICIHIYMFVCMYTCVYACIQAYTFAFMCLCVNIFIHVCIIVYLWHSHGNSRIGSELIFPFPTGKSVFLSPFSFWVARQSHNKASKVGGYSRIQKKSIKRFHVLGFLPFPISPVCVLPFSCDPSPTTLLHLP